MATLFYQIVVPAGETPETILDNNKTYDVIWQVLNALRSVDERFEATVNKLELNKQKPKISKLLGLVVHQTILISMIVM